MKTSQSGRGAAGADPGAKEQTKAVFGELYPSTGYMESLKIDEAKYRAMGPFEGWQYIMERMEL